MGKDYQGISRPSWPLERWVATLHYLNVSISVEYARWCTLVGLFCYYSVLGTLVIEKYKDGEALDWRRRPFESILQPGQTSPPTPQILLLSIMHSFINSS